MQTQIVQHKYRSPVQNITLFMVAFVYSVLRLDMVIIDYVTNSFPTIL